MYTILTVEDDLHINNLLKEALGKAGYACSQAFSGTEALLWLEHNECQLILLDLMLPGLSGEEVLQQIRQTSNVPVIVLTAKGEMEEKLDLLTSGADDYMTKPPDRQELVLRIKALLRRARIVDEHRITIGDVELDYDTHTVRRGHDAQVLPPKEFNLLYKLLAYPERTFTRLELLDEIWGMDSESDDKTVNVHINRLRTRFYDWPEFEIQTIRGIGYRAIKKV